MNSKNNELPEGVLKDVKPYVLQGNKILFITDGHPPYHCKKSIEKALNIAKNEKIDTILFGGDWIDFVPISKYIVSPKAPDIQQEIDATVSILRYIRKLFPKARMYYKIGNHENRMDIYRYNHPEIYSLHNLKLEQLLELNNLKITLVESNTIMQVGDLFIAHGHEIGAGGLTPAKKMLDKHKLNIMFGHLHRTDQFQQRLLNGVKINAYSVGSLCNLYPDYWQNNNWNNGCAIIKRTNSGKTEVTNYRF